MNRYVNICLACVMAAFVGAAAVDLSAQAQPAGTSTTTNLGTVNIPRAVKADGQALAPGSYQCGSPKRRPPRRRRDRRRSTNAGPNS